MKATGNHPKTSFQEGSHLGRVWNLALRWHFGSDGARSPSGPGYQRTLPTSPRHVEAPWSGLSDAATACHVSAPHCWDIPSFLMGYRYHITTPEGLMTTVKLVLEWRPLMMSPV